LKLEIYTEYVIAGSFHKRNLEKSFTVY